MATQKSTQAAPAAPVNLSALQLENEKLRDTLMGVDSLGQQYQTRIAAAISAIQQSLTQPDSYARRLTIDAFCEWIDHEATEWMNRVNSEAEQYKSNFIDEIARDRYRRIGAAVASKAA